MSYALWLAAISATFVVLERLWPRQPDPGPFRRGIATDAFYVVFNGHFLGLVLVGLTAPLRDRFEAAARALGLAPTLHLDLATSLGAGAQFAIALVTIDLLKWAIHNLLHRVPWLWEVHKVHHSIERMDWLGSMRFHFGEALVYDGLLYVPLALLGFRGEVLFALAVVGTAIGHFNHANLRWRIGPLRYLLNSPEMHVWHHARDLAPARNFGINLAVWDWLFGTAYLPPHDPPRLGFEDVASFPSGPIGQALWPFRRWARRGRHDPRSVGVDGPHPAARHSPDGATTMNLQAPYSISRRLTGIGMDEARTRVTEALKREGFGVLTEIDLQATLKKKIDVDVAPYVILGACNPKLAHAALSAEAAIGLLLPCNVVVAQDGADALIAAASPTSMFSVVEDRAALAAIAGDAEARLRRAIETA